jgi:hypothetical protein
MSQKTIEQIANHYETDKRASDHNYTYYYEQYFEPIRNENLNVVEIGILRHPARPYEGASLLLWRDYFENSIIHGIDINDHTSIAEERIKIHVADQGNREQLNYVFTNIGTPDIIIEDGDHELPNQIKYINNYLPILNENGILIVEDIQDINHIEILRNNTPDEYKKYIEVYDLRKNKGRYDDILFVINKNKRI